MLGLRGCRLGNLYPEITEMQTRAILEAALELKSQGKEVYPEFMVPLTSILYEFQAQKKIIDATAQQVFAEHKVGTMTEIPCAALTAHRNRSRVRYRAFFERLSS